MSFSYLHKNVSPANEFILHKCKSNMDMRKKKLYPLDHRLVMQKVKGQNITNNSPARNWENMFFFRIEPNSIQSNDSNAVMQIIQLYNWHFPPIYGLVFLHYFSLRVKGRVWGLACITLCGTKLKKYPKFREGKETMHDDATSWWLHIYLSTSFCNLYK